MCSAQDKATVPFARFHLTEQVFKDLRVKHDVMNCTEPRERSCDEMPFFDWEAEKLAQVFDHFKEDEALCGLLAAMMQYVHEGVQRERGTRRVPAPIRKDTIGMFYAPSPTTEQKLATESPQT